MSTATPQNVEKVIADMNALSERVSMLLNEGDRVDFTMTRDVTFQQGSTNQAIIAFNMPKDGAYFASELALYPAVRRIAVASTDASDVVFCPTTWTTYVQTSAVSSIPGMISGEFRIRTSRNPNFMNQAIPIGLGFSAPMPSVRETAYVGSTYFAVPEYVPGGTALTVELSLGFTIPWVANELEADNDFAYEYQVSVVLSGYKRIHAFK